LNLEIVELEEARLRLGADHHHRMNHGQQRGGGSGGGWKVNYQIASASQQSN
jgi:hypothetical protein